jgi:hypothetical protein
MESFINPKAGLEVEVIDALPEKLGPPSPADAVSVVESLKLQTLFKMSVIARNMKTSVAEARSYYPQIRADCLKMSDILSKVAANATMSTLPFLARKLHVRYQSGYGTLLCIAIFFNFMLRLHSPLDFTLIEDLHFYVVEVLVLAETASQYRPMGSSSMPLCFIAAYAVTDELEKLPQLEAKLKDWETDFPSSRWWIMALRLRAVLADPIWLGGIAEGLQGRAAIADAFGNGTGATLNFADVFLSL